jgi:hypothetical protein
MTVSLSLEPEQAARLVAAAEAKGTSTDSLLREAVDRVLADAPLSHATKPGDVPPIWEVIEHNMRDAATNELAQLPRDGASQHDHYLYGHAKR